MNQYTLHIVRSCLPWNSWKDARKIIRHKPYCFVNSRETGTAASKRWLYSQRDRSEWRAGVFVFKASYRPHVSLWYGNRRSKYKVCISRPWWFWVKSGRWILTFSKNTFSTHYSSRLLCCTPFLYNLWVLQFGPINSWRWRHCIPPKSWYPPTKLQCIVVIQSATTSNWPTYPYLTLG